MSFEAKKKKESYKEAAFACPWLRISD